MKKDKKIYDMVDGVPIWQHLKTDAGEGAEIKLISADYGKFAEILGRRILNILTEKGGILDKIFPDTTIISVHRLPRLKILNGAKIEMGDLALEIDYRKNDLKFGKKIVLFEIKHGRFQIEQNQIRRYSFMIKNPGEYYPKADELKIVFMMFDRIDTINCSASYSMCEFNKEIANKIIESVPKEEWNGKFCKYDHLLLRIENGMEKLFS